MHLCMCYAFVYFWNDLCLFWLIIYDICFVFSMHVCIHSCVVLQIFRFMEMCLCIVSLTIIQCFWSTKKDIQVCGFISLSFCFFWMLFCLLFFPMYVFFFCSFCFFFVGYYCVIVHYCILCAYSLNHLFIFSMYVSQYFFMALHFLKHRLHTKFQAKHISNELGIKHWSVLSDIWRTSPT